MRKSAILILIFLLTLGVSAEKNSVQSIRLHNDGYKLYKTFLPTDNTYKNTARDMGVLASKNKSKVYQKSAKLIKLVRSKNKKYYNTNKKLIEYLKKKWNKPHYVSMDEDWKNKTFKKDHKKVKALFSLSQGLQLAFNDWTRARNEAVKNNLPAKVEKLFEKANKVFGKTINNILEEDAIVYKSISKELKIIEMSK